MPYKITYQPLNKIDGVTPGVTSKETAAEAWDTVWRLQYSDEKVEITSPDGRTISWQELKRLAEEEARNA